MEFRPCIDLHNGQVKQIVGSSLADQNDEAVENFVAAADAAYYAKLYQEKGLKGGHIILLNPESSPYYEQTKAQAVRLAPIAADSKSAGVFMRRMQPFFWRRAHRM